MTAKPGSIHGYDVIDRLRSTRSSGEQHLKDSLRHRGARGSCNCRYCSKSRGCGRKEPWWVDVLCYGRASRYAHYFDIDWEPLDQTMHGKILIPVLGRPYGKALAEGRLRSPTTLSRIVTNCDTSIMCFHCPRSAPGHRAKNPDRVRYEECARKKSLTNYSNYRAIAWRVANRK